MFVTMSSSACALLSATVLLFVGVLQTLGAPTPQDDPAYQLFEMNIQSLKQQAEYKLNLSREIFVNNTKTFNLPEFDLINSNLSDCFESAKNDHPNADEYCVKFIGQDVEQIISDSKNELEACTNLTHSWELIDQLLTGAEGAIYSLDGVVDQILAKALTCVTKYPYSPSLKNNCFNSASSMYSDPLSKATDLAQEAYYKISGGGLLLGAEVSSCQKAESFSFEEKCNNIVSELVTNCVPLTTTTAAPPPA